LTVDENEIFARMLILPGLLIVGGFAVLVAGIIRGGKVAELRHRERMAMIERGLPPPEPVTPTEGAERTYGTKMTAGILLCGFGLALMTLIAFAAGARDVALGVGGAFVMLGLGFVATALVARSDRREPPPA
jgi:hypothetical protein